MTDERRPDEPIDDLENGPDGKSGAPSSALLHDASPADESSASENERFADDESDAEADDEARALYETIPIVPRKLPSAASFFGEPRPPKHSAHVEPAPSATWQDPTTTGVFDRPRLAGAPRAPSTAENLTAQEPPQPPVHRQTFVPIVSTPEPASVPGHGSAPQPAPMFDATHESDAGVDPDSPPKSGLSSRLTPRSTRAVFRADPHRRRTLLRWISRPFEARYRTKLFSRALPTTRHSEPMLLAKLTPTGCSAPIQSPPPRRRPAQNRPAQNRPAQAGHD